MSLSKGFSHDKPFDHVVREFTLAARQGRFGKAFADYWVEYGINDREELERIGIALQHMLAVRGRSQRARYDRACRVLRDEIRRLVRKLRRSGRSANAEFFIHWLHDLCVDLEDLKKGRGFIHGAKLSFVFGALVECLRRCQSADRTAGINAAASFIAKVMKHDGVSETDVFSSVKQYTRTTTLESWLADSKYRSGGR